MTGPKISVRDLCDRQIERWDGEFGADETFPNLWSFDVAGVKWLADRCWMLPAGICDVSDGFTVTPMGDELTAKSNEYVTILNGELRDDPRWFSATYAGVLTRHGLTARSLVGQPELNVLVTDTGERVGGLMPIRRDTEGSLNTRLPVGQDVIDTFRRLSAADVVLPHQCWELAAHLTSTQVDA